MLALPLAAVLAAPSLVQFGGDVRLADVSTLEIEVGGTIPGSQHDKLEVAGELALDGGSMEVVWFGGFSAGAGDAFDVLDWGLLTGSFGNVSLPALSTGLAWDTSRLYSDGVISVRADSWPAWAAVNSIGIAEQDLDPDCDGLANLIEYLLDTDPHSASGASGSDAGPDIGRAAGGNLILTFERPATPGSDAIYRVETRLTDIGEPLWPTTIATKAGGGAWSGSAMVTETPLPSGRVQVTVETSLSSERTFIRLCGDLVP
jgi:hypothetical protein